MTRILAIAGLALAVLLLAEPAAAQQRFAGTWDVASGKPAPWASNPNDATDMAEAKRFIGQRVTFAARAVTAPRPLGCAHATYDFRSAEADTLFEGSLSEDGRGHPANPVAVARTLGVMQKTVVGMTASCSEVEFFLVDPNTVLFGLNNWVFTLKRH